MNRTVLWVLITIGILVVACSLLLGGLWLGRALWSAVSYGPGSMMLNLIPNRLGDSFGYRLGRGMMGGGSMGGMMGGYGPAGPVAASPLSTEAAQGAVESYLDRLGNPDLALKEVMIFDNHAYAEIVEKSTGIGAMEVLIDPLSMTVYPEHGPNMMWNLKYSGMGSMMGGMMGGWRSWQNPETSPQLSAEMPVSPERAVNLAQDYLNSYLPGTQVEEHVDQFYGYYTLHTLRGGQVSGMLSVNGYSGQVFPHTWHGAFITMSEEEH